MRTRVSFEIIMSFLRSVEYKTLKNNVEELNLAIRPQLNQLVAKLVATRLVSNVLYKIISTSSASESDRAAGVLELVEQKVQLNPQCYHTFVAVLLGDEMQFGSILQKLQDTYQSYEQESLSSQSATKAGVQDSLPHEGKSVTVVGNTLVLPEPVQLEQSAAMDHILTLDDETKVVDCIHDLDKHTLTQLGYALGLKCRTQGITPSGIAHSWLKMHDDVLLTSGEPTWSTLVTALQRIGHPDIGSRIIKRYHNTDHPTLQRMETESTFAYSRLELRDVFKELITITARWFTVGVHLGLPLSTLKKIQCDYHRAENCCREMIVVWLKGNGVPVTWTSLISVLEEIDERRLAETVRVKYTLPSPSGSEGDSLAYLGSGISSLDGERYQDDQLPHLLDQLNSVSSKWEDIGMMLGFHVGELQNIANNPVLFMGAPSSWLRDMLTQWLHWAPGDKRGSTGFATREALRHALRGAGLGQLSEDLPLGGRHSDRWSEARMMAAKPKMRYS